MKTIIILTLSILLVYIIYETYQFKKEYKIIKKFSINNGINVEYYFILKQKITEKVFKIQVSKEIYDLHDYDNHISIF